LLAGVAQATVGDAMADSDGLRESRSGGVFLSGAAELIGSEDLLLSIVAAAPVTILCTTPDGRLLYINRLLIRVPEGLEGRTVYDFTDPRHHETMRACLEQVARTGEPGGYESLGQAATGVAWYETRVAPITRDGQVVALTLVATDVTARKRVEEALRESEEMLRMAVAATDMGLWSWDGERDEHTWDARMTEILGLTEPPASVAAAKALVYPDDRSVVFERIALAQQGKPWGVAEFRIVRPNGELRWVQVRGGVVRDEIGGALKVTGGALDVTERRAVEERLRQSQKLEAVGQLTAGIAHNFNNLLMAILPNLELAPLLAPAEATPLLDDARHAAERAAQLVRQLLVFAGKQRSAQHTVQFVGPIVDRVLSICRGTFDRQLAIESSAAEGLPPVAMDAGQVEQALLNVCLNARDAMADRAVRRLQVSVDPVPADSPELAQRAPGPHVAYVRIRIEDTGHGMDETTRRRVFEPFFTTKPVGKGTGLGLATAYAILKAHEGWIAVESTPGTGSVFSLYLPSAEGRPTSPEVDEDALPVGGTGRILVIDDEAMVRQVVARILGDGGYDVETAGGAREGLERFEREPEGFDLILLDLSMPDGSGRDVCIAIKERRPEQRVLYFSGYAVEDAPEADGVVPKPIGAASLLAEVGRAIERR
jgi:PAS domain S-box-containing protein